MVLSEFYKYILNIVMNIEDESGNKVFKHFDQYYGQDYPDRKDEDGAPVWSDPFPFPACFFAWQPISFESLGRGAQHTDAFFELHVCDEVVQEVSSRETAGIRNAGLEHFILIDRLQAALHGHSSADYGSIKRVHIVPDSANMLLRKHIVVFKARLLDDAAIKATVSHARPPENVTVVLP